MQVHIVIPTHTPRHLAACLASIAVQTLTPSTVVVTCDTDDPAVESVLCSSWTGLAARHLRVLPPLLHVFRPHQGEPRLNQVRNNALRALDLVGRAAPNDLVIILDGDTMLEADAVRRHLALAHRRAELIIPHRVNLDEQTTERIVRAVDAGEDWWPPGGPRNLCGQAEHESLRRRHRRYVRHSTLRSLQRALPAALIKPHKPKVLGGHHAVSVRCLRAINGYDEQYVGYGYDDDDLARRLYSLAAGPRRAIAVETILAFHLWHPSRAPVRPTEAPGYARFSRADLPTSALHGWANQTAQTQPRLRWVSEAEGIVERRPASAQAHRPMRA